MPSVIALLEVREALAREELESWLEVLREAEQCVQDARDRVEHAQIAREEVVRVFAEEGLAVAAPVNDAPSPVPGDVQDAAVLVVPDGGSAPAPAPPVRREGYDPRPPIWRAGMGAGALAGVYRQVFEAMLVASGPISAQELTRMLGRDATRLNEVEKVRHRAYAMQARGWLVRERGVFTPAAVPADRGTPTRKLTRLLPLFEQIVNLIHRHAPQAAIAFNTSGGGSVEAAQRWL